MAVLAPPDWQYSPRDSTMDVPANSRQQRSSPANDHSPSSAPTAQIQQNLQQQLHLSQQQQPHPQPAYTYPVQQQPQGSWTPSIAAAPFYPSFYQPHQQQSPQSYSAQIPQQPPYFDPANAQLAQWAYQQMMFNAQHGFQPMTSHHSPAQRTGATTSGPHDYFTQNQTPSPFNPFPSGTPPPHSHRGGAGDHQQPGQQNVQYPGFHPYRRPNRQAQHPSEGNERRTAIGQTPQPPYGRPDASGSTSSVNSSNGQRQRTNSNQSAHSSHNAPSPTSSSRGRSNTPSGTSAPSPARSSSSTASTSATPAPSPLRTTHHRNSSSSSSTSTAPSTRPSAITPALPTTATSAASTTATAAAASNPRTMRPSPLSQGNFTAAEKRMSRDDSDLAAMLDPTPSAIVSRSGGLKSRLRRALSFNAAQALKEEEVEDDDESIKASAINGGASSSKSKSKTSATTQAIIGSENDGVDDGASAATVQTKKKGRAASLFNSRFNASTDNISLSSTVSSASVMIRKLGSMGKLARRNSLAGITSLFKDKDKDKDGEGKDKKGKKKDKDKKSSAGAKGEASVASVSHVTAELDRTSSGDWTVGADMNGLSPAAKLARQHTLKSNAEAAAKAKAQQEASAAAIAASAKPNGADMINGAGVPTWDKNTATGQGSASPIKLRPGIRVNEDGTRVLVEDDDESDEGHYGPPQPSQSFHADGWDDDEDWDVEGGHEQDEDVTIRVGLERTSLDDEGYGYGAYQEEPEPWALDVRRSVERTRTPTKGILKYAGTYNQQAYLAEVSSSNRARSNSYNSPGGQSELGPLARMPSPDPDHIDGLQRHGHTSSAVETQAPSIPPLSFESPSPLEASSGKSKELPETPHPSHPQDRSSAIFQHPNFNSSAPALSTFTSFPPTLSHRSATAPSKRLAFASNLSVYDTFAASVYDRRSEPATWSRLTPALAQRIKEELNSYKMEEMEVHAASRIHTQFFV